MLFRHCFDAGRATRSCLLAGASGREALIIDPGAEQTGTYLRVVQDLQSRLVRAVDTHTHADHVTAPDRLRDATARMTIMSEKSASGCSPETAHEETMHNLQLPSPRLMDMAISAHRACGQS